MDRPNLREAKARREEMVRLASVTGGSARTPSSTEPGGTGGTQERTQSFVDNFVSDDILLNEDGFSFKMAQSGSWELQSDGEERNAGGAKGIARRDWERRKYDTTTPTLIDEDDDVEEAEIVSIDTGRHQHQRQQQQRELGFDLKHQNTLRRTPGASMYKSTFEESESSLGDPASLRRTPGASDMHRSTGSSGIIQESSVLGFGFTLTTPVAADGRSVNREMKQTWDSFHPSASHHLSSEKQGNRPPLPPGVAAQSHPPEGDFPIPRGTCSPNILRLTEDLGNLLDEASTTDYARPSQHVFRGEYHDPKAKKGEGDQPPSVDDSWASSFVFQNEANVTSFGRRGSSRRKNSKVEIGRRPRGSDRSIVPGAHEESGQTMNFLAHAQQPKPIRTIAPGVFGRQATPQGRNEGPSQTLTFGGAYGAFAPPSKESSPTFQPAPRQDVPPLRQTVSFEASPGTRNTHNEGGGAMGFQPVGHGAPSPFHGEVHVQDPHFGMEGTRAFDFSNSSYPSQHSRIPGSTQDFYPHPIHPAPPPISQPPPQDPYRQSHLLQFSHHEWPPGIPMQYGNSAAHSKWNNANWGVGHDYAYDSAARHLAHPIGVAPVPQTSDTLPLPVHFSPHANAGGFATIPQAPFGVPQGHMNSGSPIYSSGTVDNVRPPSQTRSKGDSKIRKGQQRKGSKSNKSDKARNTKKKKVYKGQDSLTPEVGPPTDERVPDSKPEVPEGGDASALTTDELAESKRSELVESPATKSAFKEFYKKFRAEERSSISGAENFALLSLGDGSLPEKVHWRVYLELADLAKRSNKVDQARELYKKVCKIQPYASQGWLEYSKLEEECGHLNRGAKILHTGLKYCEYSENLLTRAIKHEEKMGDPGRAREILSRLKHVGIDKVWRTVLEGALLEARAGNDVMARRVLKYLMHHVPWYGPLYSEAYRLERDLGRTAEALAVVEIGLNAIPRYGPLWFGAFRLCEELDMTEEAYELPRTMAMIDRATSCISKELIWKVHLDAAQMLERAALYQRGSEEDKKNAAATLDASRQRFAMTILSCPANLRWKVWLAAGRMEIAAGNAARARALFVRAHQVVPEKARATTILECARLEEFVWDKDLACAILCKSRVVYGSDWKVWLESVLLEIRDGNHSRAIVLAKGALDIHPGTGRLWAALVQLRFFEGGEEAQFCSLKRALNAVPKSGEVWCEGGRIFLNPFSQTFDLDRARRHLFFATRFTPQYGDSFLETLRLELLEQWIAPISLLVWHASKAHFLAIDELDFEVRLIKYISDITEALLRTTGALDGDTDTMKEQLLFDEETATKVRVCLSPDFQITSSVDMTDLELRCANADPNYGSLWFHCRLGPTDTARRILGRAVHKVVSELRSFAHIYIAAMLRRHIALISIENTKRGNTAWPGSAEYEKQTDEILLATPSLQEIFDKGMKDKETCMVLLESSMTGSIFATGLSVLNRRPFLENMSLNERRKALFGTDALFS